MNSQMRHSTPPEVPAMMPSEVIKIIQMRDPGLPNPDLVSYYSLERDRKIYLDDEIGENTMGLHRMILRWNLEDAGIPAPERKPIHIYIFSPGGDVDYMWSLVDLIQMSETPVITINIGIAASAAGIIFLAGHRRLMLKRSRLLIHEGSARMAGDAVKVMDASENYKNQIKQMKEFILSRTKITAAALGKQRGHDWVLDSKYCLEHGACDAVVQNLSEIL